MRVEHGLKPFVAGKIRGLMRIVGQVVQLFLGPIRYFMVRRLEGTQSIGCMEFAKRDKGRIVFAVLRLIERSIGFVVADVAIRIRANGTNPVDGVSHPVARRDHVLSRLIGFRENVASFHELGDVNAGQPQRRDGDIDSADQIGSRRAMFRKSSDLAWPVHDQWDLGPVFVEELLGSR